MLRGILTVFFGLRWGIFRRRHAQVIGTCRWFPLLSKPALSLTLSATVGFNLTSRNYYSPKQRNRFTRIIILKIITYWSKEKGRRTNLFVLKYFRDVLFCSNNTCSFTMTQKKLANLFLYLHLFRKGTTSVSLGSYAYPQPSRTIKSNDN